MFLKYSAISAGGAGNNRKTEVFFDKGFFFDYKNLR